MTRTRIAQEYEAELVALREAGFPSDLTWGRDDAGAIRIDRPGGWILVTDALLGGRLADRTKEADAGWKVTAVGEFNDGGKVDVEGDTVITSQADVPDLVAAVDLLSRSFFPVLDVEM